MSTIAKQTAFSCCFETCQTTASPTQLPFQPVGDLCFRVPPAAL